MAAPKKRPSLADRTPIAEWTAAALGLALTLGVIGYTLWEGTIERDGPPRLSVNAEPRIAMASTHVVPIVVRNASHATAAQVEVRGVLNVAGAPPEERHASFNYVPGRGEARGGLIFQGDPALGRLDLSVEGFPKP